MSDHSERDRIRSLVRNVLAQAIPDVDQSSGDAPASSQFIDTVPKSSAPDTFTHDESSKLMITEDDVRGLEQGAVLRIGELARLTPLANDIIREKGIEVGADHGGFKMKEELKNFLIESGHRVHDFGTNSSDAVDYPDFAHAVARAVADGTADVGIMIDGAGVGSAMTANKVPGVRAAACYSVAVARNSREHNGANVLTLGSGTISSAEMREIVSAWLGTELTEDRHRKRVSKIEAIDRQYHR
jgi:ribose 5-phosphate isomerase B